MAVCKQCVMSDSHPNIVLDSEGVCNQCRDYKVEKVEKEARHFETREELMVALEKYQNTDSPYDVLVPLSGGVDSSAALIEVVKEYGLKPLGFHNDHGYESDTALNNVRNLCKKMEVDLLVLQQDYAFMKQLWKHVNESNVPGLNGCFVCGNVLYSNCLAQAEKMGIPLIINGYSKGQAEMLEGADTGLDLIGSFIQEVTEKEDYDFIDQFLQKMAPLKKQKPYQVRQDLEDPVDMDKILVVPFFVFRFYQTDKKALREVCQSHFDWQESETTYPARTTNCTMNWLNNYFDIQKMNCGNYHSEYSVLIRAGEISREQAIKDLSFTPPAGLLQQLASEIGMNPAEVNEHNLIMDS